MIYTTAVDLEELVKPQGQAVTRSIQPQSPVQPTIGQAPVQQQVATEQAPVRPAATGQADAKQQDTAVLQTPKKKKVGFMSTLKNKITGKSGSKDVKAIEAASTQEQPGDSQIPAVAPARLVIEDSAEEDSHVWSRAATFGDEPDLFSPRANEVRDICSTHALAVPYKHAASSGSVHGEFQMLCMCAPVRVLSCMRSLPCCTTRLCAFVCVLLQAAAAPVVQAPEAPVCTKAAAAPVQPRTETSLRAAAVLVVKASGSVVYTKVAKSVWQPDMDSSWVPEHEAYSNSLEDPERELLANLVE